MRYTLPTFKLVHTRHSLTFTLVLVYPAFIHITIVTGRPSCLLLLSVLFRIGYWIDLVQKRVLIL
ncbi:hypothetical protein L227DRAFT_154649 [Lentinus tigrinus ALCF2SS1-6]|uniref:Uncharacterized protein n=1 Tax=Lentinus tigrinus ALCF2SS1-6 TaxID=1328759 RepID=A0A5C2SEA3_9APHY|nr:hypothetical protein L227DRAFT_154649 [Lentinus tigrinus ALCF2SS1-6]